MSYLKLKEKEIEYNVRETWVTVPGDTNRYQWTKYPGWWKGKISYLFQGRSVGSGRVISILDLALSHTKDTRKQEVWLGKLDRGRYLAGIKVLSRVRAYDPFRPYNISLTLDDNLLWQRWLEWVEESKETLTSFTPYTWGELVGDVLFNSSYKSEIGDNRVEEYMKLKKLKSLSNPLSTTIWDVLSFLSKTIKTSTYSVPTKFILQSQIERGVYIKDGWKE